MRTLSIDFASHEGHLACIDGDRIAAVRHLERLNDAAFIATLDGALGDAGWTKESIERIACNRGPGGFTSVRGGVAFANALADQLNVPVGGYHGSILALVRTNADWWFHSTKAEAIFVLGGEWSEPTLIGLDAVPTAVTTVAGDLLDTHKAALASHGATFPAPSPVEAVLPAFTDGLAYDRKGLVPWYGRGI